MVQRARAYTDEDLIFARIGIGNVFVDEDFRSTELMNANGFHGRSCKFRWQIEPYTLAQTTPEVPNHRGHREHREVLLSGSARSCIREQIKLPREVLSGTMVLRAASLVPTGETPVAPE